MSYSLLRDAIVPIEDSLGARRLVTLPDALAAFVDGSADRFADVRPHQRHGLHMFLVQIVAAAMEQAEMTTLPDGGDAFRDLLLRVAPEEAWHLVGKDSSAPAFLQPPMTSDEFSRISSRKADFGRHPDAMTILVRSKNHLDKFETIVSPGPWHWALSLVELQTMSGFEGRGLYGTVRMFGGFGTRFMIGVYDDLKPAAMWRRDVMRVLGMLPQIRATYAFYAPVEQGVVASWILPWDGTSSIQLSALHPLFVDLSRRMRLFLDGDDVVSNYIPTSAARVAAADRKGVLGDPWAALNTKVEGYSSLGIKKIGTQALRHLVIGDSQGAGEYIPSPLQAPCATDDPDSNLFFYLAALIGGQGKTEGFHEIVVPIPFGRVDFGGGPGSHELGALASGMLSDADDARKILRRAVYVFAQNGADEIKWVDHEQSDAVSAVASDILRASVHDGFFTSLWLREDETDKADWIAKLKSWSEAALRDVMRNHVSRVQLAFKAEAKALQTFHGSWRNKFEVEGEI